MSKQYGAVFVRRPDGELTTVFFEAESDDDAWVKIDAVPAPENHMFLSITKPDESGRPVPIPPAMFTAALEDILAKFAATTQP